ncbi:MAG TPA: Tm-1-like ATP-binding domain-containing protein, partial [Symbiobacteriaceae bacterium]|nr:Tm-1-like ATP-binding domain-containing protein [Symbiobacteriaceae bacterium]
MAKAIAVIGALDTKGAEFAFVRAEIARRGHEVLLIDTGVMDAPALQPDVPSEMVAQAGGTPLALLRERKDRGEAMKVMAAGAAKVADELYRTGRIAGILGMGGSAGTAVATS